MYEPNKGASPHFFSIPLNRYNGKIPFIITDIITQLVKLNSQENVGIFRIPGAGKNIKSLCEELDKGRVKDWTQYKSNEIESAFKKYLESLSLVDPLIPEDIEKEILSIDTEMSDDQICQKYHDIFVNQYSNHLAHRSTLAFIFHFLNKVILPESDKNQMNSSNLAICLYTLFYNQKNVLDSYQKKIKPIQIFIEKFDLIFEKNWYEPEQDFLMTDADIENVCTSLTQI